MVRRSADTSPATTGSLWYVVALSSVAAIGGFLFGFDSGVINGTVDALAQEFGTQSAGTGLAVASVLLGCAIGAASGGQLADRIGRRPTMIATAILFLASAVTTGAAHSATTFIVSRIVGGIAIGAASVLAPMYIAEIAPAHLRGRLSSLQQLAIVLGLFFAFLSNYLIARAAGGAGTEFWFGFAAFRWMFWMEVPPSAAFLIGVLLIPESPRFLVRVGKREEALAVFARIGSKDAEALATQVEKSVAGEHRPRLADVMKPGTRNLASIVWVGIGLAAFQQLVGINVIFYYGSVLWDAVGVSEQNALLLNLLSGFINIVATILAMALIDRVGRRPLLVAGSIGMIATLACVAVVFATAHPGARGQPVLAHGVALAGLIAVNLYIIAFGVSWGPVMWVLLGEMFPPRMRGTGLAIAGATNWVANFVVTVTFLPLMNAAGLAGAYSVYLLAALLSLFFVWRYVRETKGKALEEM